MHCSAKILEDGSKYDILIAKNVITSNHTDSSVVLPSKLKYVHCWNDDDNKLPTLPPSPESICVESVLDDDIDKIKHLKNEGV